MNEKRLHILLVDDEPQMLSAMESVVGRLGHTVSKASNGEEALSVLGSCRIDLVISDMRMPLMNGTELLCRVHAEQPRLPVVLITAYGTITQAVEAMKNGAFDFITKPFSAEDLEDVITRATGRREIPSVEQKTQPRGTGQKTIAILTNNSEFRKLLEIVTAIAQSNASVLLQGESGTGKELIARLIHSSSKRHSGPFVAVNCAAVPENLLESELFGHEKGSFTGAQSTKIGKFEFANGGTILLDEISEMDPLLQAKLLRVLQEREVDRVGGAKPIPIDVRVVATTNRDIRQSVAMGEFREDLYYRLNVVPITVPPLRARTGDVPLLIEHYVRQYSEGAVPVVARELLKQLDSYPWPGNIRELQNACERAVLLAAGGELQAEHFFLGAMNSQAKPIDSSDSELRIYSGLSVAEAERRLIMETLRVTGNNKTKAAELLGVSIRTLRNKLHEYAVVSDEIMAAD